MKTQIVKIGNSKGIRIPKPLLKQCNLSEDIELEVVQEGLLIKPSQKPRHKWDDAFKMMAENDEDDMFVSDEEISSGFDKERWRW